MASVGANNAPEVPERNECGSRPYRTDADGARRIISGASGDNRSFGHSPAKRQLAAQPRRGCTPLDETRHPAARQTGRGQPSSGSIPARDIKPQRSRCIRDILDRLTAQYQSQIRFREQYEFGGRENLRLVFRHPQQFGRGESGHRLVARRGTQGGPALLQLSAFRRGPPVIPQNAGPQRSRVRIEQLRKS